VCAALVGEKGFVTGEAADDSRLFLLQKQGNLYHFNTLVYVIAKPSKSSICIRGLQHLHCTAGGYSNRLEREEYAAAGCDAAAATAASAETWATVNRYNTTAHTFQNFFGCCCCCCRPGHDSRSAAGGTEACSSLAAAAGICGTQHALPAGALLLLFSGTAAESTLF
jgi:hypothetical protein